jgi:hypothetical protein
MRVSPVAHASATSAAFTRHVCSWCLLNLLDPTKSASSLSECVPTAPSLPAVGNGPRHIRKGSSQPGTHKRCVCSNQRRAVTSEARPQRQKSSGRQTSGLSAYPECRDPQSGSLRAVFVLVIAGLRTLPGHRRRCRRARTAASLRQCPS